MMTSCGRSRRRRFATKARKLGANSPPAPPHRPSSIPRSRPRGPISVTRQLDMPPAPGSPAGNLLEKAEGLRGACLPAKGAGALMGMTSGALTFHQRQGQEPQLGNGFRLTISVCAGRGDRVNADGREEELLSNSPPASWHKRAHVRRRSWGAAPAPRPVPCIAPLTSRSRQRPRHSPARRPILLRPRASPGAAEPSKPFSVTTFSRNNPFPSHHLPPPI